jgi:hypothetical protein
VVEPVSKRLSALEPDAKELSVAELAPTGPAAVDPVGDGLRLVGSASTGPVSSGSDQGSVASTGGGAGSAADGKLASG